MKVRRIGFILDCGPPCPKAEVEADFSGKTVVFGRKTVVFEAKSTTFERSISGFLLITNKLLGSFGISGVGGSTDGVDTEFG